MSNFERVELLEKAMFERYGIAPKIEKRISGNSSYEIRLNMNGKEAIISETMKNGMTQKAFLEINGVKTNYKRMIDAEEAAVNYLEE